jgi:hypothetical protein
MPNDTQETARAARLEARVSATRCGRRESLFGGGLAVTEDLVAECLLSVCDNDQ